MSGVPQSYAKLRKKQADEREASERAHKVTWDGYRREEQDYYASLMELIRPYGFSRLDGYLVHLEEGKNLSIKVLLDGNHWLTLSPERMFSSCHCEGPCDCPTTTWLVLRVVQHRKRDGDLNCHFPGGSEAVKGKDPDKFAAGMAKMVDEYSYSGWPSRRKVSE